MKSYPPVTRKPCSCLAALVALVMTAGAHAAEDSSETGERANSCAEAQAEFDWVNREASELDAVPNRVTRCGGSFEDPLADVDTSEDPSKAEIIAEAERSELQGDTVRLSGGVQAQQGYRTLRAEDAEFNRERSWGSLLGDVGTIKIEHFFL